MSYMVVLFRHQLLSPEGGPTTVHWTPLCIAEHVLRSQMEDVAEKNVSPPPPLSIPGTRLRHHYITAVVIQSGFFYLLLFFVFFYLITCLQFSTTVFVIILIISD